MTAIAAWADFMRQTMTVEARTGQDGFGNATYGAATAYQCRLVGKRQLVLNGEGREVVSKQTAYLASADEIGPQARVTLSTADVGSTQNYAIHPPILASARYPDEAGQHHSVLYF